MNEKNEERVKGERWLKDGERGGEGVKREERGKRFNAGGVDSHSRVMAQVRRRKGLGPSNMKYRRPRLELSREHE